MRRDCSSAAQCRPADDDRDSQARRPRHDAARARGRRRSFVERDTRTAHAARPLARAPARGARGGGAGRASPARRACRACSSSTGPSCAAATFRACRSTRRRRARARTSSTRCACCAACTAPGSRTTISPRKRTGSSFAATPAPSSTSSSRRCSPTRTARFRRRAYEDLRHLLKHKRTYQPQRLTARQRRVLARPTSGRGYGACSCKPAYRFVTRTVLGWPERSGPVERSGLRSPRRLAARLELPLLARQLVPAWTSVTPTI